MWADLDVLWRKCSVICTMLFLSFFLGWSHNMNTLKLFVSPLKKHFIVYLRYLICYYFSVIRLFTFPKDPFLWFLPPHNYPSNHIGNAHRWCTGIRKPIHRLTESNYTPAMDCAHMCARSGVQFETTFWIDLFVCWYNPFPRRWDSMFFFFVVMPAHR